MIKIKRIPQITHKEECILRKLHLKFGSMIHDYLHLKNTYKEREASRDSRVLLYYQDGKVKGWLLFIPYHFNKNSVEFELYVHSKLRRKGIGTQLIKKAIQMTRRRKIKNIIIYRNNKNQHFFNSINCSKFIS